MSAPVPQTLCSTTSPTAPTPPVSAAQVGEYRAGSGIEPPRLLREVKAAYTDEARRANISGDVELEITIRRDGTVKIAAETDAASSAVSKGFV